MQGSGSKYVKLPDNKPTVIQFADVPPKSSQGKFGPRWDYVVNGSQVFTASDYLADQINATLDALSPGQPRILTITKFKSGNRTRYDIQEGGAQSQVLKPDSPPSQGHAPWEKPRDFGEVVTDYSSSLAWAKLICDAQFGEGQYSNEDVRSIATTLFIEANRSGMKVPPMYDENTTITDGDDEDEYAGVSDEEVPF